MSNYTLVSQQINPDAFSGAAARGEHQTCGTSAFLHYNPVDRQPPYRAAPSSPVTCTQRWLSTAAYLLCCSSTAALISSTYLIATASIDHGRSCGWVREDRQIQLNCRRWILESQKRFWLHLLLTKRRVCGVIQIEEKSGYLRPMSALVSTDRVQDGGTPITLT